ncbi:MAG TPA: coenzyme F420-0:L-glutamate ligase [Jiangellaceae bacterium]
MTTAGTPQDGAYTVLPIKGLGEVEAGTDLVDLIGSAADLADGDIVVVTSKIVSKSEGRVRTGVDRDDVIDEETVRVVSQWTTPRGRTVIAQTRHGFVMAAAGVDASNVANGSVVLLPENPDGSARALRAGLRERFGVSVGVVLSDTAGRPWRDGVVDFAVGAAGVVVRDDYRGRTDAYGNDLGVTVVAVADELAAATELVRAKLDGVPVAVVRGLSRFVTEDDGPGVAALIRPAEEDRFRLGTPEAQREVIFARRDAADFSGAPIPNDILDRADAAAAAALRSITFSRHSDITTGTQAWSDVAAPSAAADVRFVRVRDAALRIRILDAIAAAWAEHLRAEGASEAAIADRLAEDDPIRHAPCLVLPCRPSGADAGEFTAGTATQNYLISLAADGYAARLSRAPMVRPDAVAAELSLNGWIPVAALGVGSV